MSDPQQIKARILEAQMLEQQAQAALMQASAHYMASVNANTLARSREQGSEQTNASLLVCRAQREQSEMLLRAGSLLRRSCDLIEPELVALLARQRYEEGTDR